MFVDVLPRVRRLIRRVDIRRFKIQHAANVLSPLAGRSHTPVLVTCETEPAPGRRCAGPIILPIKKTLDVAPIGRSADGSVDEVHAVFVCTAKTPWRPELLKDS